MSLLLHVSSTDNEIHNVALTFIFWYLLIYHDEDLKDSNATAFSLVLKELGKQFYTWKKM